MTVGISTGLSTGLVTVGVSTGLSTGLVTVGVSTGLVTAGVSTGFGFSGNFGTTGSAKTCDAPTLFGLGIRLASDMVSLDAPTGFGVSVVVVGVSGGLGTTGSDKI